MLCVITVMYMSLVFLTVLKMLNTSINSFNYMFSSLFITANMDDDDDFGDFGGFEVRLTSC